MFGRRRPMRSRSLTRTETTLEGVLRDHYRQWRLVDNKTVRRWVREGAKFDFTHDPPAPLSAYDSAT